VYIYRKTYKGFIIFKTSTIPTSGGGELKIRNSLLSLVIVEFEKKKDLYRDNENITLNLIGE